MYFPKGASWRSVFDKTKVVTGGQTLTVQAPIEMIPVYTREAAAESNK